MGDGYVREEEEGGGKEGGEDHPSAQYVEEVSISFLHIIPLSAPTVLYNLCRRLSWWNEDAVSPEANESFWIHCAEFGKGIDQATKRLAADWIAYTYAFISFLISFSSFSSFLSLRVS